MRIMPKVMAALIVTAGLIIIPAVPAHAEPTTELCLARGYINEPEFDLLPGYSHYFVGEIPVDDGVLRYWHTYRFTYSPSSSQYEKGYAVLCRNRLPHSYFDLTTSELVDYSNSLCAFNDFHDLAQGSIAPPQVHQRH